MAATKTPAAAQKPLLRAPVVIIALVLVLGGAGFWDLERESGSSTAGPTLTAEAKDYVKHLKLSEVDKKATESYLKQSVVEILGKITNTGDRTVRLVELNCVFRDPYRQLVLRERVAIVKSPLKPGETRSFRLPFDSVPESWDQDIPQLVIAQIRF
jgi:hypothetical protein